MNSKDVSYNWLSSGGAYYVIFIIWILSAVYFGFMARSVGRDRNAPNDGCLLTISTTVFVFIGGAIGLLILNKFFPWFIFSSSLGAIIGPWYAVKKFRTGRQKY